MQWDEREQLHRFGRWVIRRTQFAIWRREIVRKRARLALRHLGNRVTSTWRRLREGNGRTDFISRNPDRDVPAAFIWAAAGYRPQPYDGPLALLLSEDLLDRGQHLTRDWQGLAPRLTVHQLKGSHLECITAHVDDLVANIDKCLQQITP